MHELAAVDSLVQGILGQMKEKPSFRVQAVRVRYGATLSGEGLRQMFGACTAGTPLERAKLILEPIIMPIQCGCGHHWILNVTEQDGYPYVCPACKDLVEVTLGPDLELLEVVYEKAPEGTTC